MEDANIRQSAQQLIAEIGLPDGMLNDLLKSDDWTFVVKSAALCEAAMAHAILKAIGEPAIRGFVEKLGYSQKINLVKALLLLEDYRSLVSYIAELRNPVVHDIRKATFDLPSFLREEGEGRVRRLWQALPFCASEAMPPEPDLVCLAKPMLWSGIIGLLAMAYVEGENSDLQRRTRELARVVKEKACP